MISFEFPLVHHIGPSLDIDFRCRSRFSLLFSLVDLISSIPAAITLNPTLILHPLFHDSFKHVFLSDT